MEFDELSNRVIGRALEVRRELGPVNRPGFSGGYVT